jgi:hypothetical protein
MRYRSVRASDGEKIPCTRCRTWIAVMSDRDGLVVRDGTGPLIMTPRPSVQEHGPESAIDQLAMVTCRNCGRYHFVEPTTGQILRYSDPV